MKKTKLITIILGIVLISLIAFAGIYVKKQNRMENIIKKYEFGMNLDGVRQIELKVAEEEINVIKDAEGNIIEEELTDEEINEKGYTKEVTTVNNEEKYSPEDYKNSKKIIEKRLKDFSVEEYLIRMNESNGTIIVEVPENEETDHLVSNIGQASKFEIIDTETKEVLMNKDDLQKVDVLYGRTSEETTDISVFLNFQFSKEGTNKLTDITSKYIKIEEETENETVENSNGEENTESTENNVTENTEENAEENTEQSKEETKEKTITMQIDGTEMITTSFDETIANGVLQLTMGAATSNQEKLQESIKSATTVAVLLNNENLPVEYEVKENKYILSNWQNEVYNIMLVVVAITGILIIVLIIKYRALGLLCGITSIGVLAIISLLIRYTNIDVNLETILGVLIILISNFVLLVKLLEKVKYTQEIKKGIKDVFIKFFVQIIPLSIIAIVFSFIKWNPIYNLGLTMFWGLIVIAIYNLLVTRTVLLIKENK